MMKILRILGKEWYILAILLLPYLVMPFIWDQIPDEVPIHWNIQGEADRYGDKDFFLPFYPAIGIIIYVTILIAPVIDPKKRIKIDEKPLPALRFFIPVITTFLFVITIIPNIKPDIDVGYLIYLAVTVLLLIIGNYLRTLKPNYFVGIRTPWTLENPENWKETHRLASKLWIFTSLVLLTLAFLVPTETYSYLFFTGVMLMAIVPLGYSFYLYHKSGEIKLEEGLNNENDFDAG